MKKNSQLIYAHFFADNFSKLASSYRADESRQMQEAMTKKN